MTRRILLVAAVLAAIAGHPALAAAPPAMTAPPPPDGSVFDPRRIPSVPDAEAALDDAREMHDAAVARADDVEGQRSRVRDQIARLDGSDRDLTERIQSTGAHLRALAVQIYISGGPIATLDYLLDARDAGDLTWRRYLLHSSFTSTVDAARDYDASKLDVSAELVALAADADRLDDELMAARADVVAGEAAVADAELTLLAARHEADHRAGRIVVHSGDDGGPSPSDSQNAAGPAWDKLRFCESGGNYAIADASGMFRGAYQFAVSTWYGMGGLGDPADAPPSEQDYRAQILYDALGAKPWPVCGRFLIEDPPARSDAPAGLVDKLPPGEPLAGPGITTPSTTTTSTTATTSTSSTTTTEPQSASP
jgi:hypothetical protein